MVTSIWLIFKNCINLKKQRYWVQLKSKPTQSQLDLGYVSTDKWVLIASQGYVWRFKWSFPSTNGASCSESKRLDKMKHRIMLIPRPILLLIGKRNETTERWLTRLYQRPRVFVACCRQEWVNECTCLYAHIIHFISPLIGRITWRGGRRRRGSEPWNNSPPSAAARGATPLSRHLRDGGQKEMASGDDADQHDYITPLHIVRSGRDAWEMLSHVKVSRCRAGLRSPW